MTIKLIPFKREHLESLIDQTPYLKPMLTEVILSSLEKSSAAGSIVNSDDQVLVCGGVTEYWPNRGEAWAFVSPAAKKHFLSVHKIVKDFLKICPIRRIEASVEIGFKSGHKWVQALGFELDAPLLKAFLPDGKDVSLYSRVRVN